MSQGTGDTIQWASQNCCDSRLVTSEQPILAAGPPGTGMGDTWTSQTANPGPSSVFPAEPKGTSGKGLGERKSTVDGNTDFRVTWLDANPGSMCDPGK